MNPRDEKPGFQGPHTVGGSILTLAGRIRFSPENRGIPLAPPDALPGGPPYNLWLTEKSSIQSSCAGAWIGCRRDARPRPWPTTSNGPRADAAWPFRRSFFRQPTLGILQSLRPWESRRTSSGRSASWENISSTGSSLVRGGSRRPRDASNLSRLWCGITEYPERAPYFPGQHRPPVHPARLHPEAEGPAPPGKCPMVLDRGHQCPLRPSPGGPSIQDLEKRSFWP